MKPPRRLRPHDRGARGESSIARDLRINEQIQVPRVRLIRGEDQIGILPLGEALQVAAEADLDLVEVAPTADPPVCRIMDYGRFKYEQRKRERESRRSSKHVELREVRMKVKIGQHDLDFKARTALKLLGAGDKVKVSVMFRAREITHPEIGEQLLRRFYEQVSEQATIERQPTMEGRIMSMTLDPVRRRSDGAQPGSSAEVAAAT
ncbi:MAG: translation initiation factor IF-3 [Chloroflexi bacterium]|nr:translation initiation factor IF-3 [Chloroflexota bacterium]